MSTQDPYQQPAAAGWQPGSYPASPPGYPPSPQYPSDAYGTPPAYGAPPVYGSPPVYGAPPAYGSPPASPGHPAFAPYGAAAPEYGRGYPAYGYQPVLFAPAPTYAHWGLRVAAYLLDGLAFLPYWIGAFLSGFLSTPGYDEYGQLTTVSTPAGSAALLIGGSVSFGLWVWNRGFRQAHTGQSWGKKIVGLRLASEATGANVGVWRALLRDLAHWVDGWLLGLGYWFPLWDAKRQTFADKIVRTVSVR